MRLPHIRNDLPHDPLVLDRRVGTSRGLRRVRRTPAARRRRARRASSRCSPRAPLTDVALKGLASIADAIAVRIRGKLAEQANRSLEEQLRQSQKMEAVGRLAGGVAHDFNNLLSVDPELRRAGPSSDLQRRRPDARRTSRRSGKAGARAADLTRQLLMFSRQQVLEPKVLDLNDVLVEHGQDAAAPPRRGRRADVGRRPRRSGAVRVDPGSHRAGDHEPGRQRARRDAHRRPAHDRDRERRRSTRTTREPPRRDGRART